MAVDIIEEGQSMPAHESIESSLPADKLSVAIRLIRDLGLPVVMLAVVCFALWQSALWIMTNVVQPTMADNKALVEAHVEANKEMLKSLSAITTNIESLTKTQAANTAALEAMADDLQSIKLNTAKAADELPKINSALNDLNKQ